MPYTKTNNPNRSNWNMDTLSSYIRSILLQKGTHGSTIDDFTSEVFLRLWKATRAESDLWTLPKSYIQQTIETTRIDSWRLAKRRPKEVPFSVFIAKSEDDFDPTQVADLPAGPPPEPRKRGPKGPRKTK